MKIPRHALARILDTPHLERIVPLLKPELLHRVIEVYGLEDSGDLVALATPGQLSAVLDLDLWQSARPGLDEQFDAERFGAWLEVLLDAGTTKAAERLAALDADLVTTGFAQHIRVVDPASEVAPITEDGDELPIRRLADDHFSQDLGGYTILCRRPEWWGAVVSALAALDAEQPDCFHSVMHGCRRLSNSTPEIDGLDELLGEREQALFDLALEREQRREASGYLAVEQARAFLAASRQLRFEEAAPPLSPIAVAYFRAMESATIAVADEAPPVPPDPQEAGEAAAFVDALIDAGILPLQQPRALLGAGDGSPNRLARLSTLMQIACARDEIACGRRHEELAFLANALVAACAIHDRPFTAREASNAAAAVCNLGLENWPEAWLPRPDDGFLVAQDLVRVFQVGWTVLHREVCLPAAERLLAVLRTIMCDQETQEALGELGAALARSLKHGAPWQAHHAFDVLAILDMPSWASLLTLIAECPVIHGAMSPALPGVLAVDPAAFEFISENSQVASVREFIASLHERLSNEP